MSRLVEITCYRCKVVFGLNDEYYRVAKQAGPKMSWHCPNGHSQVFLEGPTEADKLRKELETQRQQNAMWQEEYDAQRQRAEAAERSAAAYKGVTTRLKNRVGRGVCPCCNRTFANLARHMAGQHPTFRAEEISEGTTIQ